MIVDQQKSLRAKLNNDLGRHLKSCVQQPLVRNAQIEIVKDNPAVVKTILAAGEEACRKAEFKQAGESDTETVDCAVKVSLERKRKDAVRHREHRGEPGPG